MGGWNNKSEGLDFPQIVLSHLKRILELSSHELRVSERIIVIDSQKTIIETEDFRKAYCQAIKNLGFVLIPYFDKTMKDAFDKEIVFLKGFAYQIIDEIKDKEFLKRHEEADDMEKSNLLTMLQIEHAETLFMELNGLLRRVEYLAKSVFGDSSSDDDVIDDEEGSE